MTLIEKSSKAVKKKCILVTGGAGFIGANFILNWILERDDQVVNLDKLTYAGNLQNLEKIEASNRYVFVKGDICDSGAIEKYLQQYQPFAIVHFAAESHVDRSIHSPEDFVRTNVLGTFTLLEVARNYWLNLDAKRKTEFRFLHVSTDEVYGSLDSDATSFTETTAYAPNSPYAASKAAADHLVRSYFKTYGLPTLTTHCGNNFGSFQFPEKLIPLVILNAQEGRQIPIYGDGSNVRDWIYVEDHCAGIRTVLESGVPGDVYNIGAGNERSNLEVVQTICDILDECLENAYISKHRSLIQFIKDRPGHDQRYSINSQKIENELGWRAKWNFEDGLYETVRWYLQNQEWVNNIKNGSYLKWLEKNYTEREV
ncbi:MAG: dTDP-glucose 4,6-dehydratase [Gammaproteobacteria bacterium]|nr:dTDP-glucose 4,6-dehydratase [Gammaproteobacteria bacterium]